MGLKIKARKAAGDDYGDEILDDSELDSPDPGSAGSGLGGKRRAAAGFDLESQRAAGKAAVKSALAGALAGGDPFSPSARSPMARGGGEPGGGGGREPGAGWRFLVNLLILFPWSCVLLLSWIVNKWQLAWRPIGGLLWWGVDQLDQRAPSLVEWLLWLQGLVSLGLHVITVGVNLGVIWIMWDNGHRLVPICMVTFYGFAHYAMAVTMFKELDLREAGGTYFSDVVAFGWRVLDVLFFDIQLCASVVHSNRMMESMTQLMFKGYEEARVALTALLFSVPCCVLVGIEYGVFNGGELVKDVRDINILSNYRDQLYAAVCFSVINSLEKILRLSMIDPWQHEKNDGFPHPPLPTPPLTRLSMIDPWLHEKNDGFPVLYVRSHAARLPGGLVRDWLFRCRVALEAGQGRMVLKDLYAHYVQQVKERAHPLSDPHRAILLRKAMHYFNTRRLHLERRKGGAGAGAAAMLGKPMITHLIAGSLEPGQQLSKMLADIILDSSGLVTLDLSNNGMDDAAVAGIMDALRANEDMQIQFLDLSGNAISAQGCAAVAEALGASESIYSLSLAGCPCRDEGAVALAEALKSNIGLFRLDLGGCQIGPEGAIALATALKQNAVLTVLNLSGTAIGNGGVDAVCRALRTNSFVKELDLSRLVVDDKAANCIAQMLAVNKGVEKLSLTHTGVTDQGAQLICNALQSNTTLQSIDVAHNPHMDKSWQKLLNHVAKGKAKA
ncbi:MAG: hypothetical protein J3K34DRAFT_519751 [Monoraphidium minutum]|nr:MAG: hypothetical protein J3K34DRAFT_519751 [Monoraphidium minutum]